MIPKVGDNVKLNQAGIRDVAWDKAGKLAAAGTQLVVINLSSRRRGSTLGSACVEWISVRVEVHGNSHINHSMAINAENGAFYTSRGKEPLFLPWAEVGVTTPRNNDGRSECFWCRIPTAKRGGGMYDVCPQCGK